MATKVLLLDDDAFNREGMRLYLAQQGFTVLEAGDAATARQQVIAHRPDVLIADIVIPPTAGARAQMSQSLGIRLVSRLKRANPALAVVVFSAHEDRGSEVWQLVREGMRGIAYLLKGSRPETLLNAIHEAMAGRVIIDPEVLLNPRSLAGDLLDQLTAEERPWVEHALARLDQLTPREKDVADRLAASHNTDGIAQSLNLSPKTVENHIGRIYDKLGLTEMASQAPELRKAVILAKACMVRDLRQGGK